MSPIFAQNLTDQLYLGLPDSEKVHQVVGISSQIETGGLNLPDRVLLPLEPSSWKGGQISFSMKIDPAVQNYVTVKFWGDDRTQNRLVLYVDGKQMGWFHLGEIENLDSGNEGDPAYNGRFFYRTSPLPLSVTKGKTELNLEIRAMGPIWGYGTTWEQYQKNMVQPSRGVYAVYTHTDGFFVPPSAEAQGKSPDKGVRTSPGPEVLDELKARENQEIQSELKQTNPLNEIQIQFLGNAYSKKWSDAYNNPAVVEKVVVGIDALYKAWKDDPKVLTNAPAVYNPDWLRFGPAGEAVKLLAQPLASYMEKPGVEGTGTRRSQWSELFVASRDDSLANRRLYTNQTMIVDLNAYRANRALEAIDPPKALPEGRMLDYLKQSIGLKPWLGSDTPHGPEKPMGDNYWQLTKKGLTKELGYVGYYGEVIDWVTEIYEATRPVTADGFGPGDEEIRQQLVKVVKARGIFRYPMLDDDGHPAMRIEAIVGWRDEGHYPGNIAYAERPSWDASALFVVPCVHDPVVLGYAQQMLKDNQLFDSALRSMKDRGLRVTAGLLGLPDQYEYVASQKPSGSVLPMTPGQPDFVWSDEEDGVVAIKHKDETFYASLYWRARNSINFLARVHDTLPAFDRIAEVHEDEQFEPSGLFYTRPDWINMAFGNGGLKYPPELHQILAGETLPIAKIPGGIPFQPGDENPYAGRASFYQLQYGHFLIGMNSSTKPVTLKIPGDVTEVENLSTHKAVKPGSQYTVDPETTAFFLLNK